LENLEKEKENVLFFLPWHLARRPSLLLFLSPFFPAPAQHHARGLLSLSPRLALLGRAQLLARFAVAPASACLSLTPQAYT
jgi:hypothetical protein